MEDIKTGRSVIAKAAVSISGGWSRWGNIAQEAHHAGAFLHPYIAVVYDMAVDKNDDLFMIMEDLPNRTLKEWLEFDHPLEEIGAVLDKVSSALEYVHTKMGLIFADMKPANIGFDELWNPKLIDFGISKHMDETGEAEAGDEFTPMYTSPEQRRGSVIDIRSDVYSLAATIFAIFVDRTSDENRDRFEKDLDNVVPFRRDYDKTLSTERKLAISRVLHKALSKDPKDRHHTVKEFNDEFQNALGS